MGNLKSEHKSEHPDAKNLIVFGGNAHRRNDIITLLSPIPHLNIYATLSEEEGLEKIDSLPTVDLVLIGGRYTEAQRATIKKHLLDTHPKAKVTEPGIGYAYSNENIFTAVQNLTEK